jgi:MFS superfamily sulfate permease-like transporter
MTFVVSIFTLLIGLTKSGSIVSFVSRPIFSSFLTAAALIICVSQLPYFVFDEHFEMDSTATIPTIVDIVKAVLKHGDWNVVVFSLIVACLLTLLKLWKKTQNVYSVLIVILASGLAYFVSFGSFFNGLPMMGNLDIEHIKIGGFPEPWTDSTIEGIAFWSVRAMVLSLVGCLETFAAAQNRALTEGYTIDFSQEMFVIGAMVYGVCECGVYVCVLCGY